MTAYCAHFTAPKNNERGIGGKEIFFVRPVAEYCAFNFAITH
jgi:hypothetical protein